MSYALSPVFKQRFFDNNGLPLAGGNLYTYSAGTTTPKDTYTNPAGTLNTNPIVLDASGYADVWVDPAFAYKFVLNDANGNTLWTVDNVSSPFQIASWSSGITYSQGAIVQDLSGFGLLYVSLTNNNVGNALTNVAAWRMFGGNYRSTSSSGNCVVTDDVVASNSTGANLTQTLPQISVTPIGKEITIKDIGTGGHTTAVQAHAGDTFSAADCAGTAAQAYPTLLRQGESVIVLNNGTTWVVRASDGIPDGAVSQAKLAGGYIRTMWLEDSTGSADGVTTAKIATSAVTTAKIADSTGAADGVTTAKIATSAVTTAKIADSTGAADGVTTAKIANNAITQVKKFIRGLRVGNYAADGKVSISNTPITSTPAAPGPTVVTALNAGIAGSGNPIVFGLTGSAGSNFVSCPAGCAYDVVFTKDEGAGAGEIARFAIQAPAAGAQAFSLGMFSGICFPTLGTAASPNNCLIEVSVTRTSGASALTISGASVYAYEL